MPIKSSYPIKLAQGLVAAGVASLVLALGSCGGSGSTQETTVAPMLSASTSFVSLVVSQEVKPIAIANSGGSIVSCSVAPTLPTGLSLESTTCRISGTPTQAAPETLLYTFTATNPIGQSELRIFMRVNSAAPPEPPAPTSDFNLMLSEDNPDPGPFSLPLGDEVLVTKAPRAISPNLQSGGILFVHTTEAKITTCSVEPTLPTGLNLISNPFYCLIEGAPTSSVPRTNFVVSALALVQETDSAGQQTSRTARSQVSVGIEVPVDTSVPKLVDRGEVLLYVGARNSLPIIFTNIGEALNAIMPTSADGSPTREPRCFISPNTFDEVAAPGTDPRPGLQMLPDGWQVELTPNRDSCRLDIASNGTPAIAAGADGTMPVSVSYRVRVAGLNAEDRGGDALAIVTVVNSSPPTPSRSPLLTPLEGPVVLSHQNAFGLPIAFTNSGGNPTTCYMDQTVGLPNLPRGLELRLQEREGTGTCVITGMPLDVQFQNRNYRVVAQNALGFHAVDFTMRVEPIRPIFVNEVVITSTEPIAFTVPSEVSPVNITSGAMLDVDLPNNGGPATLCRFVSNIGSNAFLQHPDFTATLNDTGTSCKVSGAAPALGSDETTRTVVLFVEISNLYRQSSYYQLSVVIGSAAASAR